MINKFTYALICCTFAVSSAYAQMGTKQKSTASQLKSNPVVLIVNDKKYTLEDMANEYDSLPAQIKDASFEESYQTLVKRMAENELLFDIANTTKSFRDEPQTKKALAQITKRALLQLYVSWAIQQIPDSNLKPAYEEFVKNFPKGKERLVGHILLDIKSDPEGKKAQEVLDSLLKNTDTFENLAKSRSIDRISAEKSEGKLGWLRLDKLPEWFKEPVTQAKVSTVWPKLVKTEYGWHVVKVYEERDAVPPTFEETKDLIRLKLAEDVVGQQLNKAKQTAKIQMFDMQGKPLPADKQ